MAQNIEQVEAIGKQFAEHYYQKLKSDRPALTMLYQPQSVLHWEGKRIVGQGDIGEHFKSVPFQNIDFKFNNLDCQPTVTGGVLVFVTGQLITEGQGRPLSFSQVFHLVPTGGSWTLANDMFRLNYG